MVAGGRDEEDRKQASAEPARQRERAVPQRRKLVRREFRHEESPGEAASLCSHRSRPTAFQGIVVNAAAFGKNGWTDTSSAGLCRAVGHEATGISSNDIPQPA